MAAETQKESLRERAGKRVGQTVCGSWELSKLVGFGGMAAVYAAKHESGRTAALKIMHVELCGDDEQRERFLREGEIARKIEHPGVVRIIGDDVTEQNEPVLVMELLRGRTLSSIWRKHGKKLPLEHALRIGAHILDTLCAFHDKGIVHRDLKPSNVFITKKGAVKILDLGVAQHREEGREMTRAGLAMGTPSFMAPEQALGKSEDVDHRADVYAVGATLYTLISGKRLHRGKTVQESHIMAATQPAPSIARVAPDLSVDAVALVDKALQWDPRNRFQSAKEMLTALQRVLHKPEAVHSEAPPSSDDSEKLSFDLDLDLDGPSTGARGLRARDSGSIMTESASVGSMELESGAREVDDSTSGLELELDLSDRRPQFEVQPAKRAFPKAGVMRRDAPTPAPGALADAAAGAGGAAPGTARPGRPGFPATIEDVPLPAEHALTPMLVAFDRLLRTARQYGPSHPETQTRIQPVYEEMIASLQRMPDGIHLRVLPFCFTLGETTVWEPKPPGDLVPYTLSVAGVRELHIVDGVEEGEFRELLGAMMIDANTDATEISTQLWEAPFQHIRCRIEEDLGADHVESLEGYFSEAAELEKELEAQLSAVQKMALTMQREDVMEAAAIAAMRDASENTASMLQLDHVSHKRLAAATRLPPDELRARHDRLLIDAFEDAANRRDLDALVNAVGAYSRRLVRLGRDEELFGTHRALVEHMRLGRGRSSRLTPAFISATLFPGDVLQHVMRTAEGWSDLLTEEQQQHAVDAFGLITRTMSAQALPMFLKLADRMKAGPILDHIVAYVVRISEGEEEIVLQHLEHLNPLTAQSILRALLDAGGDRVKSKLRPLLTSKNSALRCEAIALIASSHIALTQELMKLFRSPDRAVRKAALDTFVRHKVRSAGPRLVTVVEDDAFVTRHPEEQQEIFEALWKLNPARSEALLSKLVAKHGLMHNEELDAVRTRAARMLGERADTQRALDALQAAEARRPWNSAELRQVAAAATKSLLSRVKTPSVTPPDEGQA